MRTHLKKKKKKRGLEVVSKALRQADLDTCELEVNLVYIEF